MKNYIPDNALNLECFAIKGDEAFIGFNLPNGNFHFVQIPYTGVKLLPINNRAEIDNEILLCEKAKEIECLMNELKEEREQHQITMNAMTNAVDANYELTEKLNAK